MAPQEMAEEVEEIEAEEEASEIEVAEVAVEEEVVEDQVVEDSEIRTDGHPLPNSVDLLKPIRSNHLRRSTLTLSQSRRLKLLKS